MSNKPTVKVPAGDNIYLRGVNMDVTFSESNHIVLKLINRYDNNNHFSIGGDVRALFNYKDVNSVIKIPDYAFYSSYKNDKTLTNCSWYMDDIREIGKYSFYEAFYNTLLTNPLNFSNVTSVGEGGFGWTYFGCTSLTTGPDFSNLTTVGNYSFSRCFSGCSKLTQITAPNIPSWDTSIFNNWLNNVASSGVVRKPDTLTIPTGSTSGVPTDWTTEDY